MDFLNYILVSRFFLHKLFSNKNYLLSSIMGVYVDKKYLCKKVVVNSPFWLVPQSKSLPTESHGDMFKLTYLL